MDNANANSETLNGIPREAHDISMTDAPTAPSAPPSQPHLQEPTPAIHIPTQPQPQPQQQQQQQQQSTSRAPSLHPDPAASTASSSTTGPTMPTEAIPHGAPVRQYINSKITGVLLEGIKIVAREQPKDPLRVLGEFLLQRSKELEGKDGVAASGP
ncbi:hypothetical protein N657DRAFT_640983 [Parathielavia appendiculata]|uniref:Uncharacterized protein n=1 Tax=Parathielavia appendiculata TaxID=2587402 RepID=A0AAN6U5Z7_9PEZI|nr:hypothetical protein N657DRAFT_640983 [Parathielavia appendiculata]